MESFESYENFNDWYEALIKAGEETDKSFSYKLMFLEFYDRGMTPEETLTHIIENGIVTE
ncbi:TPA: hypothetical protein ACHFOT_003526 [Klebsiella pneumoniae]|uniref:Uncharacterized protein n=1 Tax=Klebsiella pneumoniae TaxID=573 RepID=A0A486PBU0_KLEPN|nr:hypothetical protein [Klebsiella pneumoniae]HDU2999115.1 hypothetical protein [Klebsiella pneumoniae subsp. pneumoniae]EIW9022146.1 hypothetical protein [Klebsiella pneumoniae]EJK9124132.1 hypothetical protein [Klebsiella pneumoniae]EJM8618036.1 hypothetical protein [Klebsiella pneumoniae]EJM9289475.1 hypothetical protein [Klebsiella pneumoniae]